MHFHKITYVAAFASSAFAGTPTSTGVTSVVGAAPQSNYCGTTGMSYCCNGGNCSAMGTNSICSTTVVCCNAQDSIDICLGSVTGNVNIYVDINLSEVINNSGPCNCLPFHGRPGNQPPGHH
ncbi:uncharacterized protein N7458_007500 [Penicillium daleae]|uniref:Hydrophobin n=1 Tax=Penicillium daleae TaxID=63821 RepID=A0AAD6C0W9_9EURO|nr:uncharacterized protein N7458_007500 [Penicillium daleae]KAJ5443628.1 hypothetical protein N7458_007500 [Penicillium daleae]